MNNKEKNNLNTNLDFLKNKKPITSLSSKTHQIPLIEPVKTEKLFSNVRPWVRFAARQIDNFVFLWLFGFIFGCASYIWMFLSPSSYISLHKLTMAVFYFLGLFLWIFIESVFLSSWGTTLGKWLLKVKVRDNKGKRLTFLIALKRSFLVWLKGMGIGLPIVNLITLIFAYGELRHEGTTTWDRDCHSIVTHEKIGNIRAAIAIAIATLSAIYITSVSYSMCFYFFL